MKKLLILIIILLVLVAGAVAGGTFYLGQESEKVYRGLVDKIAQQYGMVVQKNEFDKGFFRSSGKATLGLSSIKSEIHINSAIHHGPLIVDDLLQGNFADLVNPLSIKINSDIQLVNKTGKKPAQISLPLVTRVDLLGSGVVSLDMPAATNEFGKWTLRWPGIKGQVNFDKGLENFKTDVSVPKLDISNKAGSNIVLGSLAYQSDSKPGAHGYPIGNYRLSAGLIDIKPLVQVNKMRLETRSSENKEFINYTIRYKVDSLNIIGNKLGPGQFDIKLNRLDAVALGAYVQKEQKLAKRKLNQQQVTLIKIRNMLLLLSVLAKQSPELQLNNFNFKTDNGNILGNGKLAVDGNAIGPGQNPVQILLALKGQFDITLPPGIIRPLLERHIRADLDTHKTQGDLTKKETDKLTPKAIDAIVVQALPLYLDRHPFTKMLVYENERFKMIVNIEAGGIKINGQPWQPKLPKLGLGAKPAAN